MRALTTASVLLIAIAVSIPAAGTAQDYVAWQEQSPGDYPWHDPSANDPVPYSEDVRTYTLRGNLRLALVPEMEVEGDQAEVRQAVVRCWLCQTGSCDEGNPDAVGPAAQVLDVRDQATVGARFQVSFGILAEGQVNPANVSSYYCDLRFLPYVNGVSAQQLVLPSPAMPEDVAPYRILKAESGTPFAVELRGTIP